MDLMTLLGLIVGFSAIIGGMILEGGHLSSITQVTAAVIVFGGTAGAVLVSFPAATIWLGLKNLRKAFFNSSVNSAFFPKSIQPTGIYPVPERWWF